MSRLLCLALLFGLAVLPPLSRAGEAQPPDPYRHVVVNVPAPYWGYRPAIFSSGIGLIGAGPGIGYGSALHGIADYTRAEGEYLLMREDARKKREERRQMNLVTRKKELEYVKYHRDFIWNWEREEERKIIAHEEYLSRERPRYTEILSGRQLNILKRQLTKTSRSADSPSRAIKAEWLENINFTSGGGNLGLLKHKEIDWPPILQHDHFAKSREAIERHFETARREASMGKVSVKTIEGLNALRKQLDEDYTELLRTSKTLEWRHGLQAQRFTKRLNEMLIQLEDPKEAKFLLDQKPTAKNVAELMQYMRENGLEFAAASEGDGRHYNALWAEMAEEARNLGRANQEP